ncbi:MULTISPECIES: SDR family oxidoreductase [unclassified Roseateles]|uniref:SDR family oxidoreductase n=1 Tax=unclassified Roseateles TaxID=2626991 RepID=UPI0006FC46EB|nr:MULTISPECIES: SDR family oxidoreductase [unclassified Roseateles]KQW46659.1 oxidoreductase [Pelomonas sp. Root405]KRA73711.1 oxidoreductase [Pelomonas sp. Root662]
MNGIEGKVVAITGASSGIGEATARHLAAGGARVVIGARRTARLQTLAAELTAAGGTVQWAGVDVCSRAAVEAFVKGVVARFGRLDVLVNNAGVMPLSTLAMGRVEEWEATLDVNVKGVLYGIAAALPLMKRQGTGQFINVASIGAHRAYAGAAVYCASKFAVWAISDALRQEELGGDIRVTTISPGTTASELADHIADADAAAAMREFRAVTLDADAIARAIGFAIAQPADVDVSEIIVRPTRSPA